MKILLVALAIVLGCQALSTQDTQEWSKYKVNFKKTYKSVKEDLARFTIFKENLKDIEEHNKLYELGKVSYSKGINQFTDLTKQEFLDYLTKFKYENHKVNNTKTYVPTVTDVPDYWDWRDYGAVTGIKDQGQCGSCWAFSATGALEAQQRFAHDQLLSLSEQNLMDCARNEWGYSDWSCEGGWPDSAFDYVFNNGIMLEADYPYEAADRDCRADPARVVVWATSHFKFDNEDAIKQAVAQNGPISIAFDASNLGGYADGVYFDGACDPNNLNHAVLIIGYGNENGNDYWLIKNSWGDWWGQAGFFKLGRYQNCGVTSAATLPQVR